MAPLGGCLLTLLLFGVVAGNEVCGTDADTTCLLQKGEMEVKPVAKKVKPVAKAEATTQLVSKPLLQQGSSSEHRAAFEVHNHRFISDGYNILTAQMKIKQAEVLCGILNACVGFTFEGEPKANELMTVHFKKKMVGGVGNWTVYARDLHSTTIAEDLTSPSEVSPAPAPKGSIARALSKDFQKPMEAYDPKGPREEMLTRKEAVTWIERPETYLPNHHDWHVGYYNDHMTVDEAKRLCGTMSLCKGFTYKGTDDIGKHFIDFKSDVSWDGAGAWTTFIKVKTGPAPTPGEMVWPEQNRPGKGDAAHHPVEEASASEKVMIETHRTGLSEYQSPGEADGLEIPAGYLKKAKQRLTNDKAGGVREGLTGNPTRGFPGEGAQPKVAGSMPYNPEKNKKWMPEGHWKKDMQTASINGAKAADKKGPSLKIDEMMEVGPNAKFQS